MAEVTRWNSGFDKNGSRDSEQVHDVDEDLLKFQERLYSLVQMRDKYIIDKYYINKLLNGKYKLDCDKKKLLRQRDERGLFL